MCSAKKIGYGVMGVTVLGGIAALACKKFLDKHPVIKISKEDELYQTITAMVEESRKQPEKAAEIKLEILKLLRDRGILSQEQFDAKWKKTQKKLERKNESKS